jgi:hypothetical protein
MSEQMSKKSNKKPQAKKQIKPDVVAVTEPGKFGYEDMLGELEAIVEDARLRQAQEEAA